MQAWLNWLFRFQRVREKLIRETVKGFDKIEVPPFVHGFLLDVALGDQHLVRIAEHVIAYHNMSVALTELVGMTPAETKLLREILRLMERKENNP